MAEPTSHAIDMTACVVITIKDPDVIARVTGSEGDEWRAQMYDLRTEADVLEHIAGNAVANGATRVNQLDGWADLPDDAATMYVSDVERLA